jgi:REP element-mobilizing transposase RayT
MQPLLPNNSYHIFNHANGFENVFREDENYRYFLEKYKVYITPIAETYAYCLLPNHFHLVIRIRNREVIEELIRNKKNTDSIKNLSKSPIIEKVVIADEEIEGFLSKQFANLFSSYAQSFNKMYKRMGSLFIKNFRREPILNKQHFINAIIYTHRNPIHHGFYTHYFGWGYTSYCEILETKSELVEVEKIIKIFGSRDQFIEIHQQNLDKLNQSFEPDAP